MPFGFSERLEQLPPYLFVELDRKRQEAEKKGVDIIDLGIGDPDIPTPGFIVERMQEAIANPIYHRYPSSHGINAFRESVSGFMKRRFGLDLDPESQITALIGSKEAIFHFPLAFLNPGEVALVPTPGYPVYHIGTLFAGGETWYLPLYKENAFLPDLDAVPEDVLKRAKILWLNYPNNPTAGLATPGFFSRVVEFATKYDLIVCHDAAYSEMTFDGYKAPSFLETPGAMDVGIEFHSLSKTYNMTGWRIGFAAGNPRLISGLKIVKSNADSGQFSAIQDAACSALNSDQSSVEEMRKIYQGRRDVLVRALKDVGLDPPIPKATFYLWLPVPKGHSSQSFSTLLLEEAGIICTPGNGFGEPGEGFVRMALTVSEERLKEVKRRLKGIL